MIQYTSVFKRTQVVTNAGKVNRSLLYPDRTFDSDSVAWLVHACVAFLGLIVFSPLIVLIALAIKWTDRGPVFYRGKRVGQDGRIFWIYKFRTLKEGAEKNIGARLLNDNDRACYVTKIGRFLKRSKLDELPQLLNVIRGEMRLAGPRPLRPIFLSQFERDIQNYMTRFQVPPGVTGIAQLRGGYYTSARNKLRYDRIYIRNVSLLLDLQLILLTFVKILNRWLTLGFFGLFLFLFVSFVPASEQPVWNLSLGGVNIEPVAVPHSSRHDLGSVQKGTGSIFPLSRSAEPPYLFVYVPRSARSVCCGRSRSSPSAHDFLRRDRFFNLLPDCE